MDNQNQFNLPDRAPRSLATLCKDEEKSLLRGPPLSVTLSLMTPEAQRIAIAEACGWENIVCSRDLPPFGNPRIDGSLCEEDEELPNYLSDLNAMHEAEKTLRVDQLSVYLTWLAYNVDRRNDQLAFDWVRIHATAAQRAEAFLRTLGLWKD